jgi:hypothetical protein
MLSCQIRNRKEVCAVMPLPPNVAPPPEDIDDLNEDSDSLQQETNKWQDLGLSQLQ